MVESHFKCQACGQQFETKSDLKDHEKICAAQAASQRPNQPEGEKTRGAGTSRTA